VHRIGRKVLAGFVGLFEDARCPVGKPGFLVLSRSGSIADVMFMLLMVRRVHERRSYTIVAEPMGLTTA